MCRMIIGVFSQDTGVGEITPFIESLRAAAEHDPLLVQYTNGRKTSHSDGWGYVIISPNYIVEYKSLTPIYMDEKGYSQLINSLQRIIEINEAFAFMAHARLASPEYRRSLVDTHPFHFYTADDHDSWLVMNGTLTKECIKNKNNRSDTYNLVKDISNEKFDEIPQKILEQIIKNPGCVRAGLAIGIIGFNTLNSSIRGYFVYYTRKDENCRGYYDYYDLRLNENYIIMSSTVKYYLSKKHRAVVDKVNRIRGPAIIRL